MFKAIVLLLLSITFEVVGTSCLKASDGFTKLLPSVIAVICYALVALLLSLTVKYMPLSIAYALWSGVGLILITIIDYFIFHQQLGWVQIFGIVLIMIGAICTEIA